MRQIKIGGAHRLTGKTLSDEISSMKGESGSQLRVRYDKLKEQVAKAKETTAEAKLNYEQACVREQHIGEEFEAFRTALDAALDTLAAQEQVGTDLAPQSARAAEPLHVPPYLRELIAAFPASGGVVQVAALCKALSLTTAQLNARIQKAKKLDLLARTGQGQYVLTPLGLTIRGPHLRAIDADTQVS